MPKVFVTRQQDLQDCGVCCLSSIIRYYDGYVPMERLRIDTHTTKDGSTAYNLLNAASKYGFEVRGVKITSLDDNNIFLPAIAHMKYKNGLNHFVVIYTITKNKVILMDPAKGKVSINRQEFLKNFSQILLMFYPREKIIYLQKGKNIFEVLGTIINSERKLFSQIIVISIILTALSIIGSYYFKIGLDAISDNTYLDYFKLIVLVFGVITIFKCLFFYMRIYLENHLNKNIDVFLLSDFLNHLYKIPSRSIGSRSSGEIISRVRELNNIKSLYTELFVNFLLDFLLALVSIPILISISSKMFLVLFFVVAIYFIIGLFTTKTIYRKAYQNITLEEEFNSYLLESIDTYSTVKNLNLTNYVLKNVEEKLSKYLYDNYTLNNYLNNTDSLKNGINEIGFFVANTVGLFLIIQQQLSITSLITFNSLMSFFLNPLKNLIDILPKYNFFKATFDKISDFINIPTEKLGKRTPFNNYAITVDNVSYSYNDYNLTLKNIAMKIKKGEKVMFKGKSGCGKSTMCNILIKEFLNYQGEIYIGEKNLKDYSLKTIRDNILYVSQKEQLFTASIKDNILLGRNISEEKFLSICKICGVDKIVLKKPFRYETIITNNEGYVSGGERQRIVLARSLLKEAKIIILDEVLSEVDFISERKIILDLKKNYPDKTIIYITHKAQEDLFDTVINFEALK